MKNFRISNILRINYIIVFLIATIFTPASGNAITVEPPQYPLNVKKTVSGVPEGQTGQVEPNEQITYNIDFDNNNNDVMVTGISIVDTLPSDVTFVSASGDRIIGNYNRIEHTFSWYYVYISPGETVHLDLTVQVNSDVTPGQSITNVVSVDSMFTSETSASVDVIVTKEDGSQPDDGDQTDGGELIIDSDDIQIIPDIINREDPFGELTVVVKLPAGIGKNDVRDEKLILRPSGLVANEQFVSETEGRAMILAVFDKAALLNAVFEDYFGPLDLEIVGKLTSDRTFHGYATIYIIGDGDISEYVSSIDVSINQIWDYGDPNDDNDLMYEFRLEIEAWASYTFTPFNIDAFVEDLEFTTPAGNVFTIPKLPGQWSNGIWKSYEYDPEWGNARWLYRARSSNLNDLKAYGDGVYTIKVNNVIDSDVQMTIWYVVPGTNDPIPQPTQKPVLTSPMQGKETESPVTFTWEPCTDKSATEVRINVKQSSSDDYYKEYPVDKERTILGPVTLTDGSWEAELDFGQWVSSNIDDWVSVEVGKYSRSRQQFTVVGYPRSSYEVWGGDVFIGLESGRYLGGGYGSLDQLEAYGYIKLGESDGQVATFFGKYRYYMIATRGEFRLDCIRGPGESYYMSFEPNVEWMNISEPNNLLGPPDGKYAKIGSNQLWDDFSGYLVFTNPENWTELTTITTTTTVLTDFVIENISVTPETLRRDGTVTNLMVALELPEGIAADQISEEPLVILPGNVKANNQIVSEIAGRTVLVAMFDRAELMDAIDDYGQVRLTVLGTLTSGQTFSGDITITITRFAGN
jgi:uncharacterized repeat protein (TIGR01451 family)